MPITVIPAPDQSGANEGFRILADSLRQRNARVQQQQKDYQDLVIKLSDPNTTEDQQNAILTQDPVQFQKSYGVPLAQVGKDVASFRTAASTATGAPAETVAPNGMSLSAQAPAGNRRILVPHPEGTPAQQQATAALAHTQAETAQSNATTEAEVGRNQYYQQQLGLNAREAQQKEATTVAGLQSMMRTKDGQPPTPGMVKDYMAGTFDLYPTTEAGKRLESARTILNGDPNDPATHLAQMDLALDHNIKVADLSRLTAETDNYRAESELRAKRMELLGKGIDPDTGLAVKAFDPKDMVAVNTAFNSALNTAMGTLGFPTRMTTDRPWLSSAIPTGIGNISIPFSLAWGTQKMTDNPKLAAAMFGNGIADPAQVRTDLLATAEPGDRIKTIDVPGIDKKTGTPAMIPMTVDQAVPIVTQLRRKLGTEMPGVFAAMRTVSPTTLVQIAASNPVVEQMAKAYAPDVAQAIDAARATVGKPGAAAAADPNVAPLLDMRDRMQKQIDDIKRMIQGSAAAPGTR